MKTHTINPATPIRKEIENETNHNLFEVLVFMPQNTRDTFSRTDVLIELENYVVCITVSGEGWQSYEPATRFAPEDFESDVLSIEVVIEEVSHWYDGVIELSPYEEKMIADAIKERLQITFTDDLGNYR